jgi:hypothetical protein
MTLQNRNKNKTIKGARLVTEVKIRLAEKNILARVSYKYTLDFLVGYYRDFDTPDLEVTVFPTDILAERQKSDEEAELEGTPKINYPDYYLETLALYRKIAEGLVDFGIILFHGSTLELDGEAFLFTAKSGTGKSTHTRLWREVYGDRVRMVNDDKPLIAISDEGIRVYGTPWNGKHRLGENVSAPLSAICILERGKENSISELNPSSEFPKILSQTYRKNDADFMRKTLSLLSKLLSKIRVFRLYCNMNPEAARVAYEGMKGKK